MDKSKKSPKTARKRVRKDRKGLAPLCLAIVSFNGLIVLIERELVRKGKEGVQLRIGFPGGKKWQAWGVQRNTLREACEELKLPEGSLVVEKYLGSWHHPQFPARLVHYTVCKFKDEGIFIPAPGKNIRRILIVNPEEMVRLTSTTIFPPLARFLGLTSRKIRSIRRQVSKKVAKP